MKKATSKKLLNAVKVDGAVITEENGNVSSQGAMERDGGNQRQAAGDQGQDDILGWRRWQRRLDGLQAIQPGEEGEALHGDSQDQARGGAH